MVDLKHVRRYVYGACCDYLSETGQTDILGDSDKMYRFCSRVTDIVYCYLKGYKKLDASCSDFECTVALDAKEAFDV